MSVSVRFTAFVTLLVLAAGCGGLEKVKSPDSCFAMFLSLFIVVPVAAALLAKLSQSLEPGPRQEPPPEPEPQWKSWPEDPDQLVEFLLGEQGRGAEEDDRLGDDELMRLLREELSRMRGRGDEDDRPGDGR